MAFTIDPASPIVPGTLVLTSPHQVLDLFTNTNTAEFKAGTPFPVLRDGFVGTTPCWLVELPNGHLGAEGKAVNGVPVGEFTPSVAPSSQSFNIAGTVGGANATVTWR